MASMPLYWQPPPQHSSSASATVGPFIAVLIVVTVLCVLAGVIGRLCSGKTIMGYGDYDMEKWAESRCASCIDGHILPHRPRHASSGVSAESEGHVADPCETDGDKQDARDHVEPPSSSVSL